MNQLISRKHSQIGAFSIICMIIALCIYTIENQKTKSLDTNTIKSELPKSPLSISGNTLTQKILLDQFDQTQPIGKYLVIYEDIQANLGLDEIKTLTENKWRISEVDIPALGHSKSAIWLRLKIDNPSSNDVSMLLDIANSNLDDIQIFLQNSNSDLLVIQQGDQFPFNQRDIIDRYFVTPVEFRANSQTTIYLRIVNMGSLQFPIYLNNYEQFRTDSQNTMLLWGAYFGLTLIMAMYNFILYISVSDKSYLYFSLFIIANMMFHSCLQGLGFQFLWPEYENINQWALQVSNASLYLFGGLFISEFVRLKDISIIQFRVMSSIILVSLLMVVLSPWMAYHTSVMITTVIAFPFAISSVVASLTSLRKGNQAARFFLGSWLVFVVAVFTLAANKMGYIPRNLFTENGFQIGNALSILLIAIALADRINFDKRQRIAVNEEKLRLEKKSRKEREKYLQADIDNKEAKLRAQQEIITAKEEALLAKTASKTKSNFLATMSHEIRTPLNGIIGVSDMLMETSLNREQIELLSVIRNSGRSLSVLINDILEFSKIEAGKMQMEYCVFELRQLYRDVINNFTLLAKEKNIKLCCEIKKDVPQYFNSDQNRLQQILLNLLGNAMKFTEQGSIKLVVSLSKLENSTGENSQGVLLKTEVIDTGIGLSDEQMGKLFISFSQADGSTTRKYGGTGLGLSISKRLVELLGGEIGVISQVQKGSNFWFISPSKPISEEQILSYKSTTQNSHSQEDSLLSKLKGKNVLVAEDNKVNQLVIKGMLTRLGINCYLAETGDEALAQLTHNYEETDAVLMDCEMPVMDGYDTTRAIRQWENTQLKKRIPIIAVTAHALDEMVKDSISSGMDAHISKPIDKQKLLGVLIKYL